jgi:hypothetical protein
MNPSPSDDGMHCGGVDGVVVQIREFVFWRIFSVFVNFVFRAVRANVCF